MHLLLLHQDLVSMMQILISDNYDQSECLIILPLWPTQIWYPLVMELLIQRPVMLPRKRKLLSIPQTDKMHPLQNQMRLYMIKMYTIS
jgi:hypothetical protein